MVALGAGIDGVGREAVREIRLKGGFVALVDDADLPRMAGIHWYRTRDQERQRGTSYAIGNLREGDRLIKVRMHRLIMDAPKGAHVDHINGNGLDNRRCNLRICTPRENARNQRLPKHNTSGFKGVHYRRQRSCWSATIVIDRRQIHLGSFVEKEAAARAYDEGARLHFGEFARLNFPAGGSLGAAEWARAEMKRVRGQ